MLSILVVVPVLVVPALSKVHEAVHFGDVGKESSDVTPIVDTVDQRARTPNAAVCDEPATKKQGKNIKFSSEWGRVLVQPGRIAARCNEYKIYRFLVRFFQVYGLALGLIR